MFILTIRLPEDKHERLSALAQRRMGISAWGEAPSRFLEKGLSTIVFALWRLAASNQ